MIKPHWVLLPIFLLLASACSKTEDPYAAFQNGDYQTAREKLMPLADQGDPQAQTFLAAIYQMEHDYADAIKLYNLAARHNHAPAQYNLGVMLHEGTGVEQNLNEAYAWLFTAAQQGHSKAQDQLENMVNEITPNMTMQAKEWVRGQLKNQ